MVRCGWLKTKRVMKNREEARDYFKSKDLSYRDISKNTIDELVDFIKEELASFENNGFTMKMCAIRKNDISYGGQGEITKCYLRVKGIIKGSNNGVYKPIIHFKEREAVSFNQDGFIGFAGWSDDKNVRPFIDAFVRWVNEF